MLDRLLVERKAQQLAQYLESLKVFEALTLEDYLEDETKHYAIERLMQLIVDEAIDINGHVILASRQPPPKDYYSSFIQLAALGVYPRSFALDLAPTTALRNALVHEYEEVDPHEAYCNIRHFLKLYPRYLKHVLAFLERKSPR